MGTQLLRGDDAFQRLEQEAKSLSMVETLDLGVINMDIENLYGERELIALCTRDFGTRFALSLLSMAMALISSESGVHRN